MENKAPFSFGVGNAENSKSQNGGVQKEDSNEKANEKPSATRKYGVFGRWLVEPSYNLDLIRRQVCVWLPI